LQEVELASTTEAELAQRILEAKRGARLDLVKVADAVEAWLSIPRKHEPSRSHLTTCTGKLRLFAEFMAQHYPNVEDLASVRADHVRAFLDAERDRGIAPRTWNATLKLLKTLFNKKQPEADAYRGFLRTAITRDENTIHRQPFTEDELSEILKAAETDDVLRGPIVVAICTAMRVGDCCQLRWTSIDLAAGFVEVRTSKTRETAEIPILPALRAELERTPRTESEFVFPKAAELYQRANHVLNRRLRQILLRAGFVMDSNTGRGKGGPPPRPDLPELPKDQTRQRAMQSIDAASMIESRRRRMKEILDAYLEGSGLPTIARRLGVSKSTVSIHLNEIERLAGVAIFRREPAPEAPAVVRGTLRAEIGSTPRQKRASVRGWHSFRVGFVTRALASGMPEELVRRVTGHTAVDVVRKHYFKPGREEFRHEFEKAMPRLLMNGAKSRDERLREIVESITPRTIREAKARLLAILDGKE